MSEVAEALLTFVLFVSFVVMKFFSMCNNRRGRTGRLVPFRLHGPALVNLWFVVLYPNQCEGTKRWKRFT